MIWCRFQAGSTISYGIIENDVITQVEGDPFAGHKLTSTKHPLSKVKLLVPFVPGTFYCVGINYRDHIVARGDVTPAGIRRKALWVLGEMERRMAALDASWRDATAVQLYTVHDVHPFLAEESVGRGAARHGVTWHFNRPPVQEIEYEMDCRSVPFERVI